MIIKKKTDIKSSEITPKELYLDRRRFMAASAGVAASLALPDLLMPEEASAGIRLPVAKKSDFASGEKETSFKSVASYNNFYEFSTDKESVKDLAANFKTRPWTILVEGEVKKEKVYDIDKLIKMFPLEERTYRLRCVEAWSMVVPWVGFPLGEFIKKCEPTSRAEFVEFRTLLDPTQMPGQARGLIKWPYREGLRLDEAMNPLTILSVGMYGEVLPNQNGAPIRLIVPWKYGFKSIKSIFKIRFVSEMPVSSWMQANPREYGFYANVNPDVDHPRWSQARERRIGEFLKRKTLMFNGYADEVGHLYSDMDLRKYY